MKPKISTYKKDVRFSQKGEIVILSGGDLFVITDIMTTFIHNHMTGVYGYNINARQFEKRYLKSYVDRNDTYQREFIKIDVK